MDDSHEYIARLVILFFEIRLRGTIESFLASFVMGAQDATRLGDGETVIVLIEYLKSWFAHGCNLRESL
jgi:hypothetical protein